MKFWKVFTRTLNCSFIVSRVSDNSSNIVASNVNVCQGDREYNVNIEEVWNNEL